MKKTTKKDEKKTETLVNFILDKSGSMGSITDSTISAFNEYIDTLKKDGNKYRFSLVLFDTEFSDVYTNTPLKDVEALDREKYMPGGMTALYDAVCVTINSVEKTVKKNQKVLTVIMTDGEENSSQEYTEKQLKTRVAELENAGNWSFVFLGANQDSWATAGAFGISTMNTANFAATDSGITKAMNTVARGTAAFAMSASASTTDFFSEGDQTNLMDDEDTKVSEHFSSLGKKSWEARKRKIIG